jgi:hypothetical protein
MVRNRAAAAEHLHEEWFEKLACRMILNPQIEMLLSDIFHLHPSSIEFCQKGV